MKSGVYDSHEGGGGIGEAGWHDKTLLETSSGNEGAFLSRGVIHQNLVEDRADLKSGE